MNLAKYLFIKAKHFSMKQLRFGVLLALICSTALSYGQYNISLGVNYVYAFGERTIDFQNAAYSLNSTQGYEITANNSYRFLNSKIQAIFEIGFRQLYFSGNSENLTYNGQLNKLIGALGGSYSFTDKLDVATYIEAENNLELDDFSIGTGDLFRISLSAESTYFLNKNLGITFLLSRAMTPITEAYIIYNPQYQVRLGVIYKFLK